MDDNGVPDGSADTQGDGGFDSRLGYGEYYDPQGESSAVEDARRRFFDALKRVAPNVLAELDAEVFRDYDTKCRTFEGRGTATGLVSGWELIESRDWDLPCDAATVIDGILRPWGERHNLDKPWVYDRVLLALRWLRYHRGTLPQGDLISYQMSAYSGTTPEGDPYEIPREPRRLSASACDIIGHRSPYNLFSRRSNDTLKLGPLELLWEPVAVTWREFEKFANEKYVVAKWLPKTEYRKAKSEYRKAVTSHAEAQGFRRVPQVRNPMHYEMLVEVAVSRSRWEVVAKKHFKGARTVKDEVGQLARFIGLSIPAQISGRPKQALGG